MSTPILSGTECASRKGFGKTYGAPHHTDSPINGGANMSLSGGPCSTMSNTMLGPHCGQMPTHTSPTIHQLHNRASHSQAHLQAMENAARIANDEDNSSNAGGGHGFGCKNPNKLFGVSPSDIDKYSRVVFPVCFVCFNLMYWIIYLHISAQNIPDLVLAG